MKGVTGMKNDLIRREDVIHVLVAKGQSSKRYKLGETWELNLTEIKEALDLLPTAQQEVIRCKDCKYRIVNKHYGEPGYYSLKAMCELDTGDMFQLGKGAEDDDWFCADAERREDETD